MYIELKLKTDTMSKKEMIEKITKLLQDIGHTWLSCNCGNYYYIQYDGENVYVLSPWGNNTKFTRISKLGEKKVEIIYNDLKESFEL